MSKTSFQTQTCVGWEAEYVARSKCQWWMGIDNYPTLDCKVIGRVYWPQGDVNRVVSLGAAGADMVYVNAVPIIEANPHVHAWILLNEASIWDAVVRAGFPAFNQRLTYWHCARELVNTTKGKQVRSFLSQQWLVMP